MWIECRLEMIFWLFKNFVEIKVNSVSNGTNVNLEIHLHANYNDLLIIWYVKNLDKSLNGLSIILVFHDVKLDLIMIYFMTYTISKVCRFVKIF